MYGRINCYLNEGRLSLEYFLDHIPETRELRYYIRTVLGITNPDEVIALRNAIYSAVDYDYFISHVDTQLRGKHWRVQLKIDMKGEDIKDNREMYGIISFLVNISSEQIINTIKSSFGKAKGNLTFCIPFVE